MDGKDGAGTRGNGSFDLVGINLKCFPISVNEYRKSVLQNRHIDRGHESVGRHDHLVARPDLEGIQTGEKRRRSAGGRETMLGTGLRSPLLLKVAGMIAIEATPFTAL